MIEHDPVLEIALEQMELQRLLPGDRKRLLAKWFGIPIEETVEVIETHVYEMGQGYE
jgi:hypothetical protein